MNETSLDKLNGLCEHGNSPSACEICNPLSEKNDNKLINKEGKTRSLIYSPELKSSIEKHPRITKQVLKLIESIETQPVGTDAEEDGIKVTYFQKRNWSTNFKVEAMGQTYHLKKELGRGTGHKSMTSFEEAERRIENRKDVRLINYQLGYTDKQGNDYFLAKWEEIPLMRDYLNQDLSDSEREEIADKLGWVYDTFEDYKDVTTANMFYDPNTKQVVLFDLQKSE